MLKSNSVASAVNSEKLVVAADEQSNSFPMVKKIGILRKPVISKIPTINAIITPRPTARPQSQLTIKNSTVKGQGIFNRKKVDGISIASSYSVRPHTSCMWRKSSEAVNQKQFVTPKSIFSREKLQKTLKTDDNDSCEKLKLERKIRTSKKSLNFEKRKLADAQAQITDIWNTIKLLESKLSKLTGTEISESTNDDGLVHNLDEPENSLRQNNVQLSSVERIMRLTQKSASEFCQQFLSKNKEFLTISMKKLPQKLSTQEIFDHFDKFEQQITSEDWKQNGEISKFLSELENSILISDGETTLKIELEKECETLRNALIAFKQEISEKDVQIAGLTETINYNSNLKDDENIELQKECESLRQALALTEKNDQKNEHTLAEFRQRISEKDAKIVRLIETINSNSKLEYDETLTQLNIELQKECESLQKALESIEENEHTLAEFSQKNSEKDAEIVRLTKTINGLQENMDNLNVSSLDIVEENNFLKEIISKADKKLNCYSEKLRINQMDCDKLADLKKQLHAEQLRRSAADLELKNCQLDIEKLRNNINQQLLDTRFKECQLQQEETNRWKCAMNELKMEKQTFEKKLISVKADANHEKSELENLKKSIEMHKRLLIIRTELIYSMQQKEDELHEVIVQQSQKIKQFEVELDEKQQCIVELLAEKDLKNFEKVRRAYKRIQETTDENDAKWPFLETIFPRNSKN